jgi:hypothetical protein
MVQDPHSGAVYVAGFGKMLEALQYTDNPSMACLSEVYKVTEDKASKFYGRKFKVEKVFVDYGSLMSGITNAVVDSKQGFTFFTGILAPYAVYCNHAI